MCILFCILITAVDENGAIITIISAHCRLYGQYLTHSDTSTCSLVIIYLLSFTVMFWIFTVKICGTILFHLISFVK